MVSFIVTVPRVGASRPPTPAANEAGTARGRRGRGAARASAAASLRAWRTRRAAAARRLRGAASRQRVSASSSAIRSSRQASAWCSASVSRGRAELRAARRASRSGSGSARRISLPMNCIWRRWPSCEVVMLVGAQRVEQLSGSGSALEQVGAQREQCLAELLQVVRSFLRCGLADAAEEGFGRGGRFVTDPGRGIGWFRQRAGRAGRRHRTVAEQPGRHREKRLVMIAATPLTSGLPEGRRRQPASSSTTAHLHDLDHLRVRACTSCRLCLPASTASDSWSTRRSSWRRRARRHRRRRRGLRRLRPVRVGAQGRARERRAQPRQVARRHGLRRPAPRQRQHLRLLARGARADRAGGLRHRPLHRRRPGGRACPTRTTSHSAKRPARPRPVPPLGHRRRRAAAEIALPLRGRGLRRRPRASPTAKAPASRRSSAISSPATRAAFAAATPARAIRCRWRRSPARRRRRHAARRLVQLDALRPTSWPRPKPSAATPPSARCRG